MPVIAEGTALKHNADNVHITDRQKQTAVQYIACKTALQMDGQTVGQQGRTRNSEQKSENKSEKKKCARNGRRANAKTNVIRKEELTRV